MTQSQEGSHSHRFPHGSNTQGTLTLRGTNVGVVGMGLMGSSIASCLLAAGHTVAGVGHNGIRLRKAPRRALSFLKGLKEQRLLQSDPDEIFGKLTVSMDYNLLHGSQIVVESTVEDLGLKKRVIRRIEEVVPADTLIGSNTSAIPPNSASKGLYTLSAFWAFIGRSRPT